MICTACGYASTTARTCPRDGRALQDGPNWPELVRLARHGDQALLLEALVASGDGRLFRLSEALERAWAERRWLWYEDLLDAVAIRTTTAAGVVGLGQPRS